MEDSNDSIQQNRETLIKDILDQLEKDALKKEIIRRLNAPPQESFILKSLKHPVFLLILGAALTGVAGNRLASFWQSREWDRQQQRQVQLKGIETKYGLINEITKLVEENNIVANDVYASCCIGMPEFDEESYRDTSTKLEAWRKSNSNWHSHSPILERKLTIYFKDPTVVSIFREVDVTEAHLEDVYRRLQRLYQNPAKNLDKLRELRNLLSGPHQEFSDRLDLQTKKLADLIQVMTNEIQADIEGRSIKNAESNTSQSNKPSTLLS